MSHSYDAIILLSKYITRYYEVSIPVSNGTKIYKLTNNAKVIVENKVFFMEHGVNITASNILIFNFSKTVFFLFDLTTTLSTTNPAWLIR